MSMYTCQCCGKAVPRGIPATRITVETRPRRYPARREANREIYRNHKWIRPDDPGGAGREVVREVIVCPECALIGQT